MSALVLTAAPAAYAQVRAVQASATVPENLNLGLREMVQQYQSSAPLTTRGGAATIGLPPAIQAAFPLARADDQGRVIVDFYLDGKDSINSVVAKLEALGCKIESRLDWYGHGALAVWLPLDQASAAGVTLGVDHINPPLSPSTTSARRPRRARSCSGPKRCRAPRPPR